MFSCQMDTGAAHAELFPALLAANCGVWIGLIHFQAFPPSHSSFGGVFWFSSSAKLKMEWQNILKEMGPLLVSLLEVSPGNGAGFWR